MKVERLLKCSACGRKDVRIMFKMKVGVWFWSHCSISIRQTPNGVCLDYVQNADPHAVAAGNRLFGYIDTAAVRLAIYLKRRQHYNKGHNICCRILETARELAFVDFDSDRAASFAFYGCLHDLDINDTGEFSAISIYHSLSVKIAASEIKGNPKATAVIDCTGGLVRSLWLSLPCEMAQRALNGSSKGAKKMTIDKKMAQFDVLNFHIVFNLPTGPFVACESVIVGRNAKHFHAYTTAL